MKHNNITKFFMIVTATLLVFLFSGCNFNSTDKTVFEFTNGNFTAGIDFPAGVYDLEAVKGGGNVSSSDGVLNEILGVESKNVNSEFYKQKVTDVPLEEGTMVSINKVLVKMVCKEVKSKKVEKRVLNKSKKITLSDGEYIVGVDIPEGVYNIVAVKGAGNVSSSNMHDGGLNAVMGTKDKNRNNNDFYQQEYFNIIFPEGTKVKIKNVTVDLIPHKK